ncbi:hypothetical protein DFJ73DRAFT_957312 [Zopfochytrium polystomum]|nr:hypothetical protein DFJ73DRAFT_957312 [Zopfochytrium polystomum]
MAPAPTTPPSLADLPDDVLVQLAARLRTLEDLLLLSSSCRRLNAALTSIPPQPLLRLAVRTAPTFFSPHPHILALAVARPLCEWVAADPDARAPRLIAAMQHGGVGGIVDLAIAARLGITFATLRRVLAARFTVLNPLSAVIDGMVASWRCVDGSWERLEDAATLECNADTAAVQLVLYGELFGGAMDGWLRPRGDGGDGGEEAARRRLAGDVAARIEFVKYCIPTPNIRGNARRTAAAEGRGGEVGGGGGGREQGLRFTVLPVGPYAPEVAEPHVDEERWNHSSLCHLLGGGWFRGAMWKRAWRRLLVAAGAEDDADGGWPAQWRARIAAMAFARGAPNYFAGRGRGRGRGRERGPGQGRWRGGGGWEGSQRVDASVEEEDWRFGLFWNALTQLGGIDGMEMVAQFKGREDGVREVVMREEWKQRILQLRNQALALGDDDKPGARLVPRNYHRFSEGILISEAPCLAAELYVCNGDSCP